MNIVETIKSALDDMTRAERQVASYYLGHPNDFAFCTLDAIAQKADTSTTSVLRFCRRIGFVGYKDFQQAVQQGISIQPQLPDKFQRSVDRGDDLLLRVIGRDIQCIQDTFRDLQEETARKATELIATGQRVYTFGMRESYALAHYAYSRLLSVRPGVELLRAGTNGEIENLLSLGKEDVCLVFLFHRYTRQSIQILEFLAQRGCKLIVVTNPPLDQIESFANIVLPCHVDCGGIKNTSVAPVVLMDYLCDAVASQLGDAALAYMRDTENLFRLSDVL